MLHGPIDGIWVFEIRSAASIASGLEPNFHDHGGIVRVPFLPI